jgi:cytochrome P450
MTFDLDDPKLLFRDDVLRDPAALYAHLHRHAPVWELPGSGTFVVSTAALVAEAVGRPEDFSSNLTSLIYTGDDGCPVVFDMTHLGSGIHVMATADPPDHGVHRKLMQPLFNPGAVDRLAGFVGDVARGLVADLVATSHGDLATSLAEPLPVRVICAMVGIPDDDVEMLAPLVLQANDILAGVCDAASMATSGGAAMKVNEYLVALIRNWQVTADGTTACDVLARACEAGTVSIEDAEGIIVQLLGAGTETTTGLIGRAALQLASDEQLQRAVRERPELVPSLVEETLRFDGPFRFHYRSVARDTELGGVPIPAGSRVLLMWAAANLDDELVDRPMEFDVTRSVARSHFAFGRGMHFCIGAPLARLEAKLAIEALLAATTWFALDPDAAPHHRPSIFLRRLGSLPLVFDRHQ